jgi:hypothetical protein
LIHHPRSIENLKKKRKRSNHIKHNTLHPRKQQEMDIIGQQVTELYKHGGSTRARSVIIPEIVNNIAQGKWKRTGTMDNIRDSCTTASRGSKSRSQRLNDNREEFDGNMAWNTSRNTGGRSRGRVNNQGPQEWIDTTSQATGVVLCYQVN